MNRYQNAFRRIRMNPLCHGSLFFGGRPPPAIGLFQHAAAPISDVRESASFHVDDKGDSLPPGHARHFPVRDLLLQIGKSPGSGHCGPQAGHCQKRSWHDHEHDHGQYHRKDDIFNEMSMPFVAQSADVWGLRCFILGGRVPGEME